MNHASADRNPAKPSFQLANKSSYTYGIAHWTGKQFDSGTLEFNAQDSEEPGVLRLVEHLKLDTGHGGDAVTDWHCAGHHQPEEKSEMANQSKGKQGKPGGSGIIVADNTEVFIHRSHREYFIKF